MKVQIITGKFKTPEVGAKCNDVIQKLTAKGWTLVSIDGEAHWTEIFHEICKKVSDAKASGIKKILVKTNSDHAINTMRILRKESIVDAVYFLCLNKDKVSGKVKISTSHAADNGACTCYPDGFLDGWTCTCEYLWADSLDLDELEEMHKELQANGLSEYIKIPDKYKKDKTVHLKDLEAKM